MRRQTGVCAGREASSFPTVDTSWQRNPPIRMFTGSTCDQLTAVMSPRFGASVQWWEKTLAMVSMRMMTAGDDYKYLLRSVAAGDGDRSLSTR